MERAKQVWDTHTTQRPTAVEKENMTGRNIHGLHFLMSPRERQYNNPAITSCIYTRTNASDLKQWLYRFVCGSFPPSQWFTVLGRLTVYMMQLLKVYMQLK